MKVILFQPEIPQNTGNIIRSCSATQVDLILVKPLVAKYKAITLLKYFFLVALCINLPVGYSEFIQVEWMQLTFSEVGQMLFVIIATTFFTYLFNIYALKQLSPSTVGVFIYLQPVVATIFAIMAGADTLNALRVGAACMIFMGVFLSTRKPKNGVIQPKT